MRRQWLESAQRPQRLPPLGRLCDQPACALLGSFRAPRARDRLDDFYWFCLDHVRDYNRHWNYYAGFTPQEVEASIRADTVWQRPSWPLGGWDARSFHSRRWRTGDAFGLGGGAAGGGEQKARGETEQALAVLDLSPPVTLAEVKMRWKRLVKRLHPDANGGDKSAEERLKTVNQAYAALKTCALYPTAHGK